MSALPKIFEGTWEEVVSHANELAGHRLKVIVMDEVPPKAKLGQQDADEWATWLYDWAQNRRPLGPWDDSRDAIYEDDRG